MDENVMEVLRAFEADHVWVAENMRELLKRYAEQWIAVKDRKVVASALKLETLVHELADPAHTCIEFITQERLEMVL